MSERCSKRIFSGACWGMRGHACSIAATVQVGGKWYCKRHTPEGEAKRAKALQDKWAAKSKRSNLNYAIKDAEREVTATARQLVHGTAGIHALRDAVAKLEGLEAQL